MYRRNPDNQQLINGLQALLADTYILYIKTQNFHWNIKGPSFGPLHTLFGTQYAELALANDLIAERIRALGGMAAGSCGEFTRLSSIQERAGASDGLAEMEMVSILAEDNEKVSQECNSFMEKMNQQGIQDEGTITLLADRVLAHDKAAWMLRSHLEG